MNNESISTTNPPNTSIHSDLTYLNQFSNNKILIDGNSFGKNSHNVSVSNNNNNASPRNLEPISENP